MCVLTDPYGAVCLRLCMYRADEESLQLQMRSECERIKQSQVRRSLRSIDRSIVRSLLYDVVYDVCNFLRRACHAL